MSCKFNRCRWETCISFNIAQNNTAEMAFFFLHLLLFISVLVLPVAFLATGLTRKYITLPITKNWADAQKYHKRNNTNPATINTDEEVQRFYTLISSTVRARNWICLEVFCFGFYCCCFLFCFVVCVHNCHNCHNYNCAKTSIWLK